MKKHFRLTVLSAVTTATMLLASTAFAGGDYKGDYKGEREPMPAPVCVQDRCLRDGFYVGVGLGYDSYRVRQSGDFGDPTSVFSTINPPISGNGWNGSIFAGYGQYWDWFYLAGEIVANTTSAEGTWGSGASFAGTLLATYNTEIKARTSYGLAVLPGMKVNPSTLLYVRLGWLRTDFKTQESGISPVLGTYSYSDSEWQNGFQYGVGMETALCDNWSVRGEFTHTSYNSFRSDLNTKFSPSNNQYVVGLIYHIV